MGSSLDDLSKQYETGRGFTGDRKEDGTFKPKEDKLSFSGIKVLSCQLSF